MSSKSYITTFIFTFFSKRFDYIDKIISILFWTSGYYNNIDISNVSKIIQYEKSFLKKMGTQLIFHYWYL